MKHTRIENRHHIAYWIHVTPERITNYRIILQLHNVQQFDTWSRNFNEDKRESRDNFNANFNVLMKVPIH